MPCIRRISIASGGTVNWLTCVLIAARCSLVWSLAVAAATLVGRRESALPGHRVPLDRPSHQPQRELVIDRIRPAGGQIPARHQRGLQSRRILVADRERDRSLGGHAAGVDIAQQPEVEKADPAVGTQQVVAGVRVTERDRSRYSRPKKNRNTISP